MMNTQGLVFATAMAFSGTVILLALRLHKSFPLHPPSPILRSCLSSDERKRKKNNKRVQFAKDVVDSCKDSEDFRKQHKCLKSKVEKNCNRGTEKRGMGANRVALYNRILRDRSAQRLSYSF